jgi:hypothetical protein
MDAEIKLFKINEGLTSNLKYLRDIIRVIPPRMPKATSEATAEPIMPIKGIKSRFSKTFTTAAVSKSLTLTCVL